MSEKLEKIVAELDSLTLMEAAELSKMLQDKWGVSAAAPVMMGAMAAGGAPAAAAAPVEEKTEFDVVLKDGGAKKIEVIKVVRQLVPSLDFTPLETGLARTIDWFRTEGRALLT